MGSRVVLVNSQTKQPTAYEPPPDSPRYFAGPYQNVAKVTEEWYQAERKIGERITGSVLIAREIERAAERDRCAKIAHAAAEAVTKAGVYDDDARMVAVSIETLIRSGE